MNIFSLTAAATLAIATTAFAGPDKSHYHLFNPTPAAAMRDMSTDRPDQTESPYTVDAGHIQLEMDLINWTRDNGRNDFAFANTNLKIGLRNNIDLQLVINGFNTLDAGGHGWGDFETRLKINLWGNDGGKTAFAIMPFVKWPTASDAVQDNDSIEGGIILPLGIQLAETVGLGLMYELDINKNATGNGYHADHVFTATVGFDLTDKLGMYLEAVAVFPGQSEGDFIAQADIGWTYSPTENLQFDIGANFGITDTAPDAAPFLGVSIRF
jgi:hypothetical protein